MLEDGRQFPNQFTIAFILLELLLHGAEGRYHRSLVEHPIDDSVIIVPDPLDLLLVAKVAIKMPYLPLLFWIFLGPRIGLHQLLKDPMVLPVDIFVESLFDFMLAEV
jgi:hypothetical protein